MSGCPHCGSVTLADTPAKRDRAAVVDVRQQARSAPSGARSLYNNVARTIDAELSASRQFQRDLSRLYRAVTQALQAALSGSPESARTALLDIQRRGVEPFLSAAGLDDLIVSFTKMQTDTLDRARQAMVDAGFSDVVSLDPSEPTLSAALDRTLEAFWREKVILPTRRAIMDAAQDALTLQNLDQVAARVQRNLDRTEAQAVTEARTEMARWNRVVGATSAAQAGAELFAYLGPLDGITRPFCRALVNKIVTIDQLGELDNGQTADSPLTSGGGYNCRHSFQAVSERWVERSGLPMASESDIAAANRGGAR